MINVDFYKVLATLYCDTDNERNYIPGEEWPLRLVTDISQACPF
jgi:hypothetical protein